MDMTGWLNGQIFISTVDEKEVRPSQFQFLRGIFPLADRDGDGKLTEQEMHAYLDLQAKAAAARSQFV